MRTRKRATAQRHQLCVARMLAQQFPGRLHGFPRVAMRGAFTQPRFTTVFVGISLVLTDLVLVRSVVWLWSGSSFWRIRHKRAEVCSVPALVLGMLAAMYYTPPTSDHYALIKFVLAAEVVALLVYLAARLTFGITNTAND